MSKKGITTIRKSSDITRKWHLLDAKDIPLGRTAEKAAVFLRGKNRADFTYNQDLGGHVVIINADKVKFTGNKLATEFHRRHSGYLGNLKEIPMDRYYEDYPEKVIHHAVKGMLPKNRLADKMIVRLKIFKGEEHKYQDKF